jgi:hypothetical protein
VALTFGNVLHPAFEDRLIPDSQTSAWNDLGPMEVVGVDWHTMVGRLPGTDRWFRDDPVSGRRAQGLTTYGVSEAGLIYRWNDPTGKAHTVYCDRNTSNGWWEYGAGKTARKVSANRSGWANGGSDGLEGDGPLFVRQLGVDGINRNLVSIERADMVKPYDYPFVDPQALAVVKLTAYWFDQAKVPWDQFPYNPKYSCVTHLLHWETATKGCPWGPVTEKVSVEQDRVRALLKAAQTLSDVTEPVPPPSPIEPDHDALPMDYTLAGLEARFGTLTRKRLDGTITKSGFNINGAISNAWINRGAAEKRPMAELPPASYMVESANPTLLIEDKPSVSTIVLFDGRGADNWILYRPDPSIAWRWMV